MRVVAGQGRENATDMTYGNRAAKSIAVGENGSL
jgi:hypothetical protein